MNPAAFFIKVLDNSCHLCLIYALQIKLFT